MEYASYYGSSTLLSGTLRMYFSGHVFGEGYMDFTYRRESMDYKLTGSPNGYRIEGLDIATFKMNAFFFGFGHNWVGGNKNNITHNVFINFGIKQFEITKYVDTQSGYDHVYRRTNDVVTTRILPAVNMGYIFGIGF
jgi:hypothetical protein